MSTTYFWKFPHPPENVNKRGREDDKANGINY